MIRGLFLSVDSLSIFDSYVACLTLRFNTVYVYFHSHQFFVCLQSCTVTILVAFKSVLSQSRCSYSLKCNPCCRPHSTPLYPSALLTFVMSAFLLIMFTPGIMSVFYLILFPAGFFFFFFFDIHLGHVKGHELNLFGREK